MAIEIVAKMYTPTCTYKAKDLVVTNFVLSITTLRARFDHFHGSVLVFLKLAYVSWFLLSNNFSRSPSVIFAKWTLFVLLRVRVRSDRQPSRSLFFWNNIANTRVFGVCLRACVRACVRSCVCMRLLASSHAFLGAHISNIQSWADNRLRAKSFQTRVTDSPIFAVLWKHPQSQLGSTE